MVRVHSRPPEKGLGICQVLFSMQCPCRQGHSCGGDICGFAGGFALYVRGGRIARGVISYGCRRRKHRAARGLAYQKGLLPRPARMDTKNGKASLLECCRDRASVIPIGSRRPFYVGETVETEETAPFLCGEKRRAIPCETGRKTARRPIQDSPGFGPRRIGAAPTAGVLPSVGVRTAKTDGGLCRWWGLPVTGAAGDGSCRGRVLPGAGAAGGGSCWGRELPGARAAGGELCRGRKLPRAGVADGGCCRWRVLPVAGVAGSGSCRWWGLPVVGAAGGGCCRERELRQEVFETNPFWYLTTDRSEVIMPPTMDARRPWEKAARSGKRRRRRHTVLGARPEDSSVPRIAHAIRIARRFVRAKRSEDDRVRDRRFFCLIRLSITVARPWISLPVGIPFRRFSPLCPFAMARRQQAGISTDKPLRKRMTADLEQLCAQDRPCPCQATVSPTAALLCSSTDHGGKSCRFRSGGLRQTAR